MLFFPNKYLCCNKNYQQKFDEKLKERFLNTYKFSNHDNNKLFHYCEKMFILINIWIRLDFYNHLKIEDITDADYVHTKRVCKDFEIKI